MVLYKEWKVFELKGKYVTRLLVLIQVIWLKGSQGTYVSKKLLLLVALVELRKVVKWVQVIFDNLHYWLHDLFVANELEKKEKRQGFKIRSHTNCKHPTMALVHGRHLHPSIGIRRGG